jgi:hypothetical protein
MTEEACGSGLNRSRRYFKQSNPTWLPKVNCFNSFVHEFQCLFKAFCGLDGASVFSTQ